MDKKKVALLSAGHFATDINSGALPAVLPFLRDSLSLTYQATGGIMFANSLLSAVTQPLFGLLADHFRKPWLIPLGVILAGLGLCLTGLVGSYEAVLIAVAVSGLGAALFHPPAARLANKAGGAQKGLAVSLFSIGGNAGFVIGPPLAVLLVGSFGLGATAFFGVLAVFTSLTLAFCVLRVKEDGAAVGSGAAQPPRENNWRQFGIISVVIVVRSAVLTGLMTFIPLYLMQHFDVVKTQSAMAVTLLGFFGVASNIAGGFLSDRLGYGRILRCAYLPLPVLLFIMAHAGSAWTVWALVPFLGFCTYFAFGPTVVLGQQFLARNIAFASGVTMGLGTAMGGLCSPILGWIGDNWGLDATFLVMAVLAVFATAATFFIDARVNAETPGARK
ncbi:MAG: MFS transporter [Desulfovibrionaceae bacterium]|nr:MFS transporter [Desulfovibrionaceae bacterium]